MTQRAVQPAVLRGPAIAEAFIAPLSAGWDRLVRAEIDDLIGFDDSMISGGYDPRAERMQAEEADGPRATDSGVPSMTPYVVMGASLLLLVVVAVRR